MVQLQPVDELNIFVMLKDGRSFDIVYIMLSLIELMLSIPGEVPVSREILFVRG